jgi:hypothetical protein
MVVPAGSAYKPSIAELPAVVPTLDATHRCDSCGAQAYVKLETTYGTFEFCGHHYAANELALMPITVGYVDERWRLETKLDASS